MEQTREKVPVARTLGVVRHLSGGYREAATLSSREDSGKEMVGPFGGSEYSFRDWFVIDLPGREL